MGSFKKELDTSLPRYKNDPPSDPVVSKEEIRKEALANRVIHAFSVAYQKLAEHRQDIAQLWEEFETLAPDETIKGCRTKTEFAERYLHRNIRTIQYMLQGGNPRNKKQGEIISPVLTSDSGDAVLDALINEQNRVISQMTGDGGEDLLHKAASLEGEIVGHIVRSNWKEE
jgi:hypothetical protein